MKTSLVLCAAGIALAGVALVAYCTDAPVDCAAYAKRAGERRGLNETERREVARSCGVSVIYGPFSERSEAQELVERLNSKTPATCASPGAYAALWFDDERWATFCPQM